MDIRTLLRNVFWRRYPTAHEVVSLYSEAAQRTAEGLPVTEEMIKRGNQYAAELNRSKAREAAIARVFTPLVHCQVSCWRGLAFVAQQIRLQSLANALSDMADVTIKDHLERLELRTSNRLQLFQ